MTNAESIALMHFLDVVFPRQFPVYEPDAAKGGRGWLLSLLVRSQAFYHAALATSCYDRRALAISHEMSQKRTALLMEEEKHLETCLSLVNNAAQNACPRMELGLMFAMLQLFFYEVLWPVW
jgi:hypothetical protein